MGSLPTHKFLQHASQGTDYANFDEDTKHERLQYLIEVYVDDYISLAIPRTKEDLDHVANAVMTGIHDVFPEDKVDAEDPISFKKLLKLEAMWALHKDILGFTFDGVEKTIWLEAPKRDALLTVLSGWLKAAERGSMLLSPSQMGLDCCRPATKYYDWSQVRYTSIVINHYG